MSPTEPTPASVLAQVAEHERALASFRVNTAPERAALAAARRVLTPEHGHADPAVTLAMARLLCESGNPYTREHIGRAIRDLASAINATGGMS